MTTIREAAQQALEALEDHAKQYPHMQKGYTVDAITALRAALAQQDEPCPTQRKPVVSVDELANHIRVVDGNHSLGAGALAEKIVEFLIERGISKESCDAGPRAALEQQDEPVQEPVAWIQPDHLQKARIAPFLCRVEPTQRCADFVPLYLAPPQRKPLTSDKDRPDQGATYVEGYGYVDTRAVRAIERAHGIGAQS